MPLKYAERLRLPLVSQEEIQFTTQNGLPIASGYKRIVMTQKGPLVEFSEDQIVFENVTTPKNMMWRHKHPDAFYIEYRSKDYCAVKMVEQKKLVGDLQPGFWYISAFDLTSDKYPVLIDSLKHKNHD